MRDYKRAIEILEELDLLLKDENIFSQTENDRFHHKSLLKSISNDFPEIPYEELKNSVIDILSKSEQKQTIVFRDKNYILEIPSLKVIVYTFLCIDKNNINYKNFKDEYSNILNICIDMAKRCNKEIDYTNDKIRSLIAELSNI